jgi:hypothetical protein
MNVAAGQRPEHPAPPACDDGPLTPQQEAEFGSFLRDLYPLDFGGVDADSLRDEPPSSELVELLEAVAIDDEDLVDDLALLEVVAAWLRVGALAHARAARAAAALSRRDCLQVPGDPVPVGRGRRRLTALRATGTELAIRAGCTVREGELLARDGRLFDGALAATGEALARGEIDRHKARAIADRLADVPLPVALDVQDAVLPDAGRRSPAQVDRDLTRALVEVDPTEAAARHVHARAERRVCRPRPLPDGMAGVWAVLTAEAAAALDATLDDASAAARAAGDARTSDQLRADGLVDLVTGGGLGGSRPSAALPMAGRRPDADTRLPARRPTIHVDVLVSLSSLMGLDDAHAELAGYGPITAEQGRALAAGGTWRRIVTDPLSGTVLDVGRTRYRPPASLRAHVEARDRTCGRPGCTVPARSAELDHTVPFHGSREGPTSAGNLAPLCAGDHAAKSIGLLRLEQPEPGILEWTTAVGQRVRVVPGRDGAITPLDPRGARPTGRVGARPPQPDPPPF